mmetsp:Transcript_17094/g.39279  ORF Transcript_17094/g.39279 Transcript_17094/m.39279 type:complete len:83 (-) Transcript_17094:327-575(-)
MKHPFRHVIKPYFCYYLIFYTTEPSSKADTHLISNKNLLTGVSSGMVGWQQLGMVALQSLLRTLFSSLSAIQTSSNAIGLDL